MCFFFGRRFGASLTHEKCLGASFVFLGAGPLEGSLRLLPVSIKDCSMVSSLVCFLLARMLRDLSELSFSVMLSGSAATGKQLNLSWRFSGMLRSHSIKYPVSLSGSYSWICSLVIEDQEKSETGTFSLKDPP